MTQSTPLIFKPCERDALTFMAMKHHYRWWGWREATELFPHSEESNRWHYEQSVIRWLCEWHKELLEKIELGFAPWLITCPRDFVGPLPDFNNLLMDKSGHEYYDDFWNKIKTGVQNPV